MPAFATTLVTLVQVTVAVPPPVQFSFGSLVTLMTLALDVLTVTVPVVPSSLIETTSSFVFVLLLPPVQVRVPLSYVMVCSVASVTARADPERTKEAASVAKMATSRRPGAFN
jgi:hypothetical protein